MKTKSLQIFQALCMVLLLGCSILSWADEPIPAPVPAVPPTPVTTPAPANTPSSAALLLKGQQAFDAANIADAVSALETLRKTYPQSAEVAMGTALLYNCYLQQKLPEKASPLWDQVMAKWPGSPSAYQVIDAYRRYYGDSEPETVLNRLEDLKTNHLMPVEWEDAFAQLYDGLLDKMPPDRLLNMCIALLNDAKDTTDFAKVKKADLTVRHVYAPLMHIKRFDDARAVFAQCQEKLALMGNPDDSMNANAKAYFDALRPSPARFTAEILPFVQAAQWAATGKDVADGIYWAAQMYPMLLKNGGFADAKKAHEVLVAAIAKLAPTGNLLGKAYQAYFAALGQYDTAHFWPEAQPLLAKCQTDLSAETTEQYAGIARVLYSPLMLTGHLDEVKALHDALQAALHKFAKVDAVNADAQAFKDSITVPALDAFLLLYKRAAAANDKEGAKKWLRELNLVAPESQQAITAREINHAITPGAE